MTATSLFDLLARADAVPPIGVDRTERLTRFGERLAESSLADLQRVTEYEQEFAHSNWSTSGLSLDVLRSLWQLYADWARDAEQVLARVRPLRSDGPGAALFSRLEDAYGGVRARLSVTPERVMAGEEQVRRGEVVSGAEMRDELRTRRLA